MGKNPPLTIKQSKKPKPNSSIALSIYRKGHYGVILFGTLFCDVPENPNALYFTKSSSNSTDNKKLQF